MTHAVPLSYTQTGETHSRSIYILHGLFGSSSNWRTIARHLSNDYHVVVSDARNHGDSPWDDLMTYDVMADDLGALIHATAHDSIVVIGHSMGGKTAMNYALRRAIDIKKLVIVDIAPINYANQVDAARKTPADNKERASDSHQHYIDGMLSIDLTTIKSRKDADHALLPWVSDAGIRQFLAQNLRKDSDGYHWRLNLEILRSSLTNLVSWPDEQPNLANINELTHVTPPARFIKGAESQYINPTGENAIQHYFPKSKITKIDQAGHWPHAEQPKAFMRALHDALAT